MGVPKDTERALTYGEQLVGLKFNPSEDSLVDDLKSLYARIIDELVFLRKEADKQPWTEEEKALAVGASEAVKFFDAAISQTVTAQMQAIKAVTWDQG